MVDDKQNGQFNRAISQPVQLEKSSASFVMNLVRNILQQINPKPKEKMSSNILHARSSLKWHQVRDSKSL